MLKINLSFNIIFILISLGGIVTQTLQSIQNYNKKYDDIKNQINLMIQESKYSSTSYNSSKVEKN